jgi:hypothetical protein
MDFFARHGERTPPVSCGSNFQAGNLASNSSGMSRFE